MITKFVTIIVMCILISQPLTYNTVYAHNSNNPTDPPGPSPPKIKVTVTIDKIHLNQNMDDGATDLEYEGDKDAEIVVGHGIKQNNHEKVGNAFEYDHNYARVVEWKDESPITAPLTQHRWGDFPDHTFDSPKIIYEHEECSPMDEVYYYFRLVESDQSVATSVTEVAGSIASIFLLIPVAGWTVSEAALAFAGIVTSAAGLNSDDELGVDFGGQTTSGTFTATLTGAAQSATVDWTIRVKEIPDPNNECSDQRTSSTHVSLGQDDARTALLVNQFTDSLASAIKMNTSSKMEEGLDDITTQEFSALKKETPKKIISFAGDVFDIVAADTKQSIQKTNAIKLANDAKHFAVQGKYDSAVSTYNKAFLEIIQKDKKLQSGLPDWIKQNAKWWSDGTTTDREFANSIGFLVKEKIITVNVPTNNDGTILVNENLQIPDWLRNNAKWWSDEIISDQEFISGIEFMIKQKIITFSEKNSTSDKFNELYTISKRNEAITSSLIEINQYEKKILRDTLDDAWEKYNKSKNPDDLKSAQIFDENLKNIEKRILVLSKTELLAKQDTQSLLKNAAKDGIKMMDLEKSAKGKIWTKVRPDTPEKLVQALKDVENANKQQIKDLEKTLDTLLFGSGTTSKDGTKVSPLSGDFFDSSKFFEDYFVITDHIPIQDVFNDNWTELQETRSVILEIDEFVFDEPLDLQHDEIIQDNTETTKDEQPSSEIPLDGKQVSILVINGKYYPQSQFYEVPAHQPNCDAMHYHSEFPQVRSVEGVLISDPNPSTCGFGKTGLIPIDVITMTQEQIDSFKAAMGFEP